MANFDTRKRDVKLDPLTGSVPVTIANETVGTTTSSLLLTGAQTGVGYNTQTTILTRTASATYESISRISCSGQDHAKFQLYIDTTLVETKRSGGGLGRNVDFIFNPTLKLAQGQILDVKVIHYFNGDNLDFEATVYAFVSTT